MTLSHQHALNRHTNKQGDNPPHTNNQSNITQQSDTSLHVPDIYLQHLPCIYIPPICNSPLLKPALQPILQLALHFPPSPTLQHALHLHPTCLLLTVKPTLQHVLHLHPTGLLLTLKPTLQDALTHPETCPACPATILPLLNNW